MIGGFFNGLFAMAQAWMFIYHHPRLLRYAIAPFVINVIVFGATLYFANAYFSHLVDEYLIYGEAWWWKVLEWIAQTLVVLVMLVVSFFAFTAVGNLIAAPFNDLLSEKTEHMIRGTNSDEPFSVGLIISDAVRSLGDEMKKLSLFLLAMGILLMVNFIPFAGPPVFALCSILLTLYFLVIEYTGFVCSRKRISFARQRAFIRTHRGHSLGFGVAVMLTLMLPLIQLFTIPLAVVAATHFCVANMDSSLLQHPE
ncbi:MAG: sulfate transporter CysZ [Desulfuromonadaceae bacterium]